MDERFQGLGFYPADILLPRDCDLTKWAVVACDQYTSQPEYWQRVEFFVGNSPSALHLILPESSLEGPSVETDILDINNTMSRYLREGRFRTLEHAMIYVERTLESGRVRRGVVGMVDLEQYDYEPGADTLIRATEGTVLSRIPPRVAVRKNAPIELPHAMVLADDPGRTVIEPLTALRDRLEPVYDFELMEHSGHLRGWLLGEAEQGAVAAALRALSDPAAFHARYGTKDKPVMLYAMGDGDPEQGWDYVERFCENLDGTLLERSSQVYEGVASGQYAVGLTFEEGGARYVKTGGPVRLVYMEEGVLSTPDVVCVAKNAPHPEEAGIFVDFVTGWDAQSIIAGTLNRRSVRTDVDEPEGLPDKSSFPSIESSLELVTGRREEWLERFAEIYEKELSE